MSTLEHVILEFDDKTLELYGNSAKEFQKFMDANNTSFDVDLSSMKWVEKYSENHAIGHTRKG